MWPFKGQKSWVKKLHKELERELKRPLHKGQSLKEKRKSVTNIFSKYLYENFFVLHNNISSEKLKNISYDTSFMFSCLSLIDLHYYHRNTNDHVYLYMDDLDKIIHIIDTFFTKEASATTKNNQHIIDLLKWHYPQYSLLKENKFGFQHHHGHDGQKMIISLTTRGLWYNSRFQLSSDKWNLKNKDGSFWAVDIFISPEHKNCIITYFPNIVYMENFNNSQYLLLVFSDAELIILDVLNNDTLIRYDQLVIRENPSPHSPLGAKLKSW